VVDGARRDEDVLLDFSIFELFEEGLKKYKRNFKKMLNFQGEEIKRKVVDADPRMLHFHFHL
jgi:hypothetical protein